jgi:CBS domain containing-hemolysin-like protein
MGDVSLLIALGVLFLLAVFLAAAEASLLRVPRVRVEVLAEQGDAGAGRLLELVHDLPRVMNTVLLTVLLVQIGAATLSGVFAERHFGGIGITITSVVLTIVLFVYAEAIPKTYAVRRPMAVARFVARPVQGLTWLLRPVVSVLIWFADLQAPGKGIAGRVGVSEEELRRLALEAATVGEIEAVEAELVDKAFELGDTRVDQILVPRPDIIAVAADRPIQDALEVALASGHRRIPVYEGDVDHITGVVRLRELAAAVTKGHMGTVGDVATPPLVVPESKRVIELLHEMQEAGRHFAVAVDEFGGTAGIVTIEDVVAELVGDVADEGERRLAPIRRDGDRLLVEASTDVADLEAELGAELPGGDFHTVGGLVIHAAGRIPVVGDDIEIGAHSFRVISGTSRRVRLLEVR